MKRDLKIIGWRTAELLIFAVAFPFLFVGAWGRVASDYCGDRARSVGR